MALRWISEKGYEWWKAGAGEEALENAWGWVPAHRLVASYKIGRWVLPREVVHHIDGNKLNNDPDNLEVLGNLSDHMSRHRGGVVETAPAAEWDDLGSFQWLKGDSTVSSLD